MKRGKKLLVGLIIGMFLISFVGFVSANWFTDLFKFGEEGDGDAELATIGAKDVNLTVAGAPDVPQIVFISDLGYASDAAGVAPAERDLVADSSVQKNFEFYVYSTGGVNALPGPGSGVSVANDNALITLKDVVNSPNRERLSSDAGAVTCAYNRDASSPAGSISGYVGVPSRVYRCSVAMQYYDDHGTLGSPNWEVYAYVKDIFNQEEGYTAGGILIENGVGQPSRATFFNRLTDSKMVPDGGVMEFGSVSYGAQTTQPQEVGGKYPLSIVNIGNADISQIDIQGEDIPGKSDPTKYILAEWFSVAPSNPCTGTALIDSAIVNSGISQINNGPSASSDLRVCLTLVEASATNQDYSTEGGTAWTFGTSYVN